MTKIIAIPIDPKKNETLHFDSMAHCEVFFDETRKNFDCKKSIENELQYKGYFFDYDFD